MAFVLIIGKAERFPCGKQVASYLGLVPGEESSGNQRRLGHITKQGSSMLRFLLVEAAQVTVRSLPERRRRYFHLMMRRGRKIAEVAMARRLAVHLYWMMREGWDYQQWTKFGSHVGQPPAPLHEEFELVIMIGVAIEEMHGSGRVPDLSGLQGEPWLVGTEFFPLERNGAFSKADAEVRS